MKSLEAYTDEMLLRLLREGNSPAFEEIYRRYWRGCYKSAFRILEDEAACMDALQDVFVWVWEKRAQVAVVSLKSYLCTAVKFKMLNIIRHGKISDAAIQDYKRSHDSFSFTDNSLEVKELKMMIDQFVDSLPTQAGKIFRLSRTEQLSHKEIAQRLNLSEKTVKNQINISLKKLKTILGRLPFLFSFL